MGKKTTTLYLDEDLVHRCKELHINISKTVEMILAIVLEKAPINEEEIRLEILKAERVTLQDRLEKATEHISSINERIAYYDNLIIKQEKLVHEIKRSNEVARLIRLLNRKIKESEFNPDRIRVEAKDILTQLKLLAVPVDEPSWLPKQVERVQRLSL